MEKRASEEGDVEQTLRAHGFRVTTSRVHLLHLLERANTPLSIQKIHSLWKGKGPDITTLYRSLTDLSGAGIVRRFDLNTGTAHFEYSPNRPHHHHLICNDCGKVEELEHCSLEGFEKKVLHGSKQFKSIHSHNLEFFGTCTVCAH